MSIVLDADDLQRTGILLARPATCSPRAALIGCAISPISFGFSDTDLRAARRGFPSTRRWSPTGPRVFSMADQGAERIRATLTTTWSIAGCGDRKRIRTTGNVSTVVTLASEARDLGVFRMELGAADNPGCYFHTDIEQQRPADGRWPGWLDVPRFPTFVPTPAAVLEFVLAELWQEEWPRRLQAADTTNWIQIHRRRWRTLLGWQQDQINSVDLSTWLQLKRAIPDADAQVF